MRNVSKAQSILEYTIILGVVAAALLAMQVYFKRSLQAAIRLAADDIGEQQQGGDEVDPSRGIKTSRNALIHRQLSGAGEGESQELPPGATARIRTYEGGKRRMDIAEHTDSEGTSQYITEKEQ